MTNKSDMHDALLDSDKILRVHYLTRFSAEAFCIFTIAGDGVETVYVTTLSLETYKLPKRKLSHWLLEHMGSAAVVKTFNIGKK